MGFYEPANNHFAAVLVFSRGANIGTDKLKKTPIKKLIIGDE